jgi:hypothetical protein
VDRGSLTFFEQWFVTETGKAVVPEEDKVSSSSPVYNGCVDGKSRGLCEGAIGKRLPLFVIPTGKTRKVFFKIAWS